MPFLPPALTRRGFLGGGLGAAALLGLGACATDAAPSASGSASAPSAATPAAVTGPYTVTHKYGTTTVPAPPTTVVTLGYTDQEPVLALGVVPVGVTDFFGERPYGSWPWEQSLWNGTTPQIVGNRDEYDFEKIAALTPDLVLGLYSGMTKQDYETLSRIAPTVAQPAGYADFAAPWTVITEQAGRSLGKLSEAQQLVAAAEATLADAKQAHPGWAGRTVAVAEPFKADEWAVFGASDPKLQFMEALGFAVAPSVVDLEPGGDVATISTERLDLIDVDQLLLLIDTGDQTQQQVEANRLFTALGVAKEGRATFVPFSPAPPIGAALAFSSVLSIPYGVEQLVPLLPNG